MHSDPLLFWINSIFLGRNEIEKGLCSTIELMQFTVILRAAWVLAAVVTEDCKQERPMMQCAIFDGVV
jgi:hypothetical protein